MDFCWSSFHEEKKCCCCCELAQANPFAKVWKDGGFPQGPRGPACAAPQGSVQLPAITCHVPVPGKNSSGTHTTWPGCSTTRGIYEGKTFPEKKEVCRRDGWGEWNCCPQPAGGVRRKESRELECQFGTKLRRRMREKDAAWLPQLCSTRCLCRTDVNMHTGMNLTLHFLAHKDRRSGPLSQPTGRFFIYHYLETKGNQGTIFLNLKKKSQENLVLRNL